MVRAAKLVEERVVFLAFVAVAGERVALICANKFLFIPDRLPLEVCQEDAPAISLATTGASQLVVA
jgi:hypothetical protein